MSKSQTAVGDMSLPPEGNNDCSYLVTVVKCGARVSPIVRGRYVPQRGIFAGPCVGSPLWALLPTLNVATPKALNQKDWNVKFKSVHVV